MLVVANHLVKIPDSISHLVNLSTLDLSYCIRLCRLPESIGSLMKLQRLLLNGVKNPKSSQFDHALCNIPNSIGKLEWLIELNLSNSGILELPESIGDLKNLKILNIAYNEGLSSLPSTISKLGNLEEFDATECETLGGEIPIEGLSSLKILRLSSTCISGFLDAFDKLSHLETLDVYDCQMLQSLPQTISKLPSLQHLKLTSCDNFRSLPELPTCLTVLEISCQHHTLPQLSHLIHLKGLTIVDCQWLESMPELPLGLVELHVHGCDELTELPNLSSLKFLSELDLSSSSELIEIKGLGALKSLAKLNVSGCSKLSNLDGLEHLESLRFLCMSMFSGSDAPALNDDLFRGLDKLKILEELQMWYCQSLIRPDLSQLTHRKQLSTRECHNLVEIKGLERLKILEKLDIEGCRSIEKFPSLLCFDNLRHLNIRGCSKLGDVQGLEKVPVVFK
ncbi:putative adenylate cyclase regulatory protein [Eucalyptus grandis]|uniref:putative adenylate cyclase regulatory protein n=1 Tax=Eucalyptus grandis TaxID=71139 RepID=UPI00192EE6E0|nr:putative adenylate cyclase regulatory protein [Eucalyptus grandis]XP_039166901.1 putative adenylate cyclase regulatory protein [Eucalyptus grandis]XP_039166902.1 putative adenylate cyclase regulatory protein [Eucalyptus grandis]XP_039166903.1 putative adenylate cyclase regulatory protein [Eucalyptus grandis]XP_039166904.1 putative adenylate cyclase regulatory protein [Eucalyptus grandis]XP_039166905.1 putative adenylate cyclase regulatory protein [Eucalyptus grandis]XP_039166906.1 putative